MNTRCLLIRGGRLFSPGDGFLGERADLLLRDGHMAEIGDNLAAPADADIITLDGEYVAPGFIDCHCHLDLDNPMGIGLHPDLAGALAGNSTVFDAGTTGADNFPGFCQRWMDQGQTRVFALLNLASNGIDTWEEASDSANFNPEALRSTVEEHRGRIVGLKLRCDREAVGKLGMEPFFLGQRLARELDLPFVVHVGEAPPFVEEILAGAQLGDLITHCYHCYSPNGVWNSLVDKELRVRESVWQARYRGVLFDVGHGGCSFSFRIARAMMEQCFFPDLISTDIYTWNYLEPVRGLYHVITKLLHLGMPLETCLTAVTQTPANYFGLTGLGRLREGACADVTVFHLENISVELTDSCGVSERCTRYLVPDYTVVAGRAYHLNLLHF